MNEVRVETSVFANGLKLIKINQPHLHSFTSMLIVRCGSRYETDDESGMAHFLEHLVFKGTKKFPNSKLIAEAIEGIGGYFNAWTASDHTAYWSVVPSVQWYRGVEMVCELAFAPKFTNEDVNRERNVILEEISRINDDPSTLVDDVITAELFKGNSLSRPIIGSPQTVGSMNHKAISQFYNDNYLASRSCLVCVGDLETIDFNEIIERYTASNTGVMLREPEIFRGPSTPGLNVVTKSTDQIHLIIGMADDQLSLCRKENYIGIVLNTILGRGMSSRLFMTLREKQGLAYAVNSQIASFEDTGAMLIYAGVSPNKLEQALDSIEKELDQMANKPVDASELEKAKALLIGSYEMSADRPVELAKWYGIGELLNDIDTLEEAKVAVNQVTLEQIQEFAKRLFDKSRRALAVVGPITDSEKLKKFVQLP